jgi:MFS family permease
MKGNTLDRLVAAGVFVFALVLYLLTVAPTASFWDAGEFIAISHGLQVSHPPGAPFYMLVGRLFSMLFAPLIGLFVERGDVALAVNLVSVVASALTILLTHLVIVRLVRIWQGAPETWNAGDRLAALGGGAIGALTFAVTDSFWFNAVESEVYALSMFFTAIVVWLILRWREEKLAEEALLRAQGQHPFGLKSDRYLVLIAYLFGLAIGVHLLNVLTLFFIALVVYFADFEREEWTTAKRWLGIVVAGVVASVIFVTIYPGLVQKLPTVAEALGLTFTLVVVFGTAVAVVWWTQTRRRPVANLVAVSVLMVLIGYSTYALIFIRSAADPPIDENDPENTEAIVSYLKREQYGATPLLKGPTYENTRSDFSREDVFFPRRWSPMPQHVQTYAQYDSDAEFFWKYQVGHMYVRYFLWQFVGRASDVQDAAWASGLVREASATGDGAEIVQTPSERASRNVYYGLPLLLGLIGMAFHFNRDWRRAFAVAVLFLITGIGIIVYLNQTPMQPRERDYSYVASFFAYSLWIGIGATGLISLTVGALADKARNLRLGAAGAVAAVSFLAVPGLVLQQNYDDHDRSGRYVAPDFAYNMLQSLAPDAIIFTNGDNDTFPLWYLQEVEGVRRDVRVVNLSLLQTPWYIKQLKNQWSRASAPLPMTYSSDRDIDAIAPTQWQPREITLPVRGLSAETREQLGNPVALPDTMTWRVEGRPYAQDFNVLYVNDQVVLSILAANAQQGWERPIYFATTAARDSQVDLDAYFQAEGLANRVVPIRHEGPGERIVPEVLIDRLSKFRFTNLDDPDVYFDENIRNMMDNYRSSVIAPAAEGLAGQGRTAAAQALLDRIEAEIPFETIPPDFISLYLLAEAHAALGDRERVIELMTAAETHALDQLLTATTQRAANIGVQYYQTVQAVYLDSGAFDQAATFSNQIADALGDESFRLSAEELRRMYEARSELSAPPAADAVPEQG